MDILGVSFDYHDSAVALIRDGSVVAATEEERLSRAKHDNGFPARALDFCLREGGIDNPSQLDKVVFYEDPYLKLDRILRASFSQWPRSKTYLARALENWAIRRKLDALRRLRSHLRISRSRVLHLTHHDSHAGAAFYCSPFEEATVLTLDGAGEYETGRISHGKGTRLKNLRSFCLPNSIGLFYSAFTSFLGFEVNEGEYKAMGMAGFGKPVHEDKVWKCVRLLDDGGFEINQEYFQFLCPEERMYTDKFLGLFGTPRDSDRTFCTRDFAEPEARVAPLDLVRTLREEGQYYADVAASMQSVTEKVLLHVVRHALQRTKCPNLCIAGGVGLNSVANYRIKMESDVRDLYVHPAAGDGGGALGAALYYYCNILGRARVPALLNPYLGAGFGDDEVRDALVRADIADYRHFGDAEDLEEAVADLIVGNKVIGWFQGRYEWGPRALGARSILANPTNPAMKEIVNLKVKFREPFRPFAPSVVFEEAPRYFEFANDPGPHSPEHFMLAVVKVRREFWEKLPAITHADGTARVHLVRREANERYYRLLQAIGRRTGYAIVLNTSFNLKGEPIVDSPLNAIRTFEWCELDYLVLGNFLIPKRF